MQNPPLPQGAPAPGGPPSFFAYSVLNVLITWGKLQPCLYSLANLVYIQMGNVYIGDFWLGEAFAQEEKNPQPPLRCSIYNLKVKSIWGILLKYCTTGNFNKHVEMRSKEPDRKEICHRRSETFIFLGGRWGNKKLWMIDGVGENPHLSVV